jgi:C-terminal processing protease CtpA/Prc
MAAGATTPEGTYGAIIYAVGQLRQAGDLHAKFVSAATAKLQGDSIYESTPSQPPTVSLINGRLGLIDLPSIGSSPLSSNSRHYVATALSSISSLQSHHHPCGWIVDLRFDYGGDLYPMLLSVGPILGASRLIGFTGRNGFRYYVSYANSTLLGGSIVDRAPIKVADFTPAPPVAVLTGGGTVSAGEIVTVAFRGRANTRSFGTPTAGGTTAPQTYRLADGAELSFGEVYYVDREGTVYRNPIKPDVTDYSSGNSAYQVTEQWLMATPQCSHAH